MTERLRVFWEKYEKWMVLVLLVGTLGLAAVALHDMQTAEGIGLYFALLRNETSRVVYDYLTDAAGMVCFLGLLVLPWRCLGDGSVEALFRLTAGWLALLPSVSIARLVHLVDGTEKLVLRETLMQGRFLEAVLEGIEPAASGFQVWFPLVVLLWVAVRLEGTIQMPRWQKIVVAVQPILLVAGVLFPVLQVHCWFVMAYLLLVLSFSLWEALWKRYPSLRTWGWLLFGLIWLRGIYKLIELLSAYNL